MMNKQLPFTITLEEADNLLFETLVAEYKTMYPNDGRMALKAAMHVCDKVMVQFEAVAARAAKSAQARAAAQARYAQPGAQAATPAPATPESAPAPAFAAPAAPPPAKPPRVRRTKAQIAAGVPLAAVAQAAPQPVPMGQPFTPEAQLFQPAPQPQAAPQPVPMEAPPVTDFAGLAQQAASQGIPQFAPGAPAFVPPAPTFG